MNIVMLGASYQTAALKDLEAIFINAENRELFLNAIPETAPVSGVILLMTCNRVEYYFTANYEDLGRKWLIDYIAEFKSVPVELVEHLLITKDKKEAINHLFSVASGIDSMVLGENEVLTQVKEAFSFSQTLNKTNGYLNKLFQYAITAGKRARTDTDISRGSYSISSIAIEAIREQVLDYFGRKILIIGAGSMGSKAIKKLSALGHPNITICNRSSEKADQVAAEHAIKTLDYNMLTQQAADFDIILTAVGSKDPILQESHFSDSSQTCLLVDLGMPRNIDTRIEDTFNISIVTVEDLKEIADRNMRNRKSEVIKVHTVIKEELSKFTEWVTQREVRV